MVDIYQNWPILETMDKAIVTLKKLKEVLNMLRFMGVDKGLWVSITPQVTL